MVVSLFLWIKLILIILCIISLIRNIAHYVYYCTEKAVIKFEQSIYDSNWWLFLANGQKINACIHGNSFIHPYCTILNFNADENKDKYTVIILQGSLDAHCQRQLHKALVFP